MDNIQYNALFSFIWNIANDMLVRNGDRQVARITCHLSKERSIINKIMAVAELLLLEYSRLCWFKEYVDTTKHHERKYYFLVISFLESMYQYIVGNVPDEREESVILFVVHYKFFSR